MSKTIPVSFQLTRFHITACHYGRFSKLTLDRSTMLSGLIRGFCNWVETAQHLEDTLIADGESEVYVKDVAMKDSLCCVVLWSKTGNGDMSLAVSKKEPPRKMGTIKKKEWGDDLIPGEPFYFLLDSVKESLWTLRPPAAQRTEREALERSLRFYMLHYADAYAREVYKESGEDVFHTVMIRPKDEKGGDLPHFSSEMAKRGQTLDELVKHAEKIKKLVHIVMFKNLNLRQRTKIVDRFTPLFTSTRFSNQQVRDVKRVKYEIDVRLSGEDVRRIIERREYARDGRIGFIPTGSPSPVWADENIIRLDKTLSLPDNVDVFAAEDLLHATSKFV